MKEWQKYTIERQCKQCNKQFYCYKYNVLKGLGNFCSKGCSNKATPRNWRGDKVGYAGVHIWMKQVYGRPRKCDHCPVSADEANFEWANISKLYRRDRNDWMRLCQPCHRKFDSPHRKRTLAQSV